MNRLRAPVNVRVFLVVLTACASALSASPGTAVTDPTTAEPRAISIAIPVEHLLRADGTLDLHAYRGSVSTAGWRMRTDANGAPVFERESAEAGIESPESTDRRVSASGCVDRTFAFDGTVYALAPDQSGNLYAGGGFNHAGGVNAYCMAKWNGTSWSALPDQVVFYLVRALALDGAGNLYVGGVRYSFTGQNVARWNGTSWSALGTGVNNDVDALALDGAGNLYAGGHFTTAGGVSANHVAKWNGTSWSALGSGVDDWVYALAVDGGGNLYVGGQFGSAGGVSTRAIARWNGSTWSALSSGMHPTAGADTWVWALAVDGGGNLYAGGSFTGAGSVSASNIARWDGTSWSALGTGMNDHVYALAVDGGGGLFAGGRFTTAGGGYTTHVAHWNGTSWSAVGGGMNADVYALALDGGANLYAGGSSTMTKFHLAVYRDADGDGYGDPAIWNPDLDCVPPAGYVANSADCDDSNAAVHPGAVEVCNGIDDNCDGHTDDMAQAPDMVGWWKGEGNANDAVGGSHGTPRNGATFVGGMVGQCFSLDGIDDYVEDLGTVSTFAFIQNTGVFTIEGWLRLDDSNAARDQTLTANSASALEKGHLFGIVNSSGQQGLRLSMARDLGEVIIDSRSPNGTITDGSWHHVAVTGDGTNAIFYVDAVAYPGSGTMGMKASGDANRAVDLGWDGSGSYFGGRLDELVIHDRTLSAGEIQAIYNAGAAGRCGLAGVADVDEPRPSARTFEFPAPWPNPAVRSTTIRFSLPGAALVRVDVFDLAGRRVWSSIDGQSLTAGEHRVDWDGRDASGRRVVPGIYEVRITTGAAVGVRRIVMLE